MSAPHTPGPWVVEANDGAYVKERGLAEWRIEERSTPSEMVVALVITDVMPLQERAEANARLIAAAPDLLAFAVALDADWTKEFPDGPDTDFSERLIDLAPETVALWRQCRAAIAKATGADS